MINNIKQSKIKLLLILSPVFLLFFLTIIAYFIKLDKQTKKEYKNQTQAETGMSLSSLKNAVSSGMSVRCDAKTNDLLSEEIYIKGKMFIINYEPGWDSTVKHILIKNNCVLEWEDNKKEGKKTCLSNNENYYDSKILTDIQSNQLVEGNYNCKPTDIPDLFFKTPTDITFQ